MNKIFCPFCGNVIEEYVIEQVSGSLFNYSKINIECDNCKKKMVIRIKV